jgi:predicted dehydrogenase
MKAIAMLSILAVGGLTARAGDTPGVQLITLDPGHFHAALVQKTMYPQVSPVVHVYAPEGPDLEAHLKRIAAYNTRADNPTHWEQRVVAGPDFLTRLTRERAGNVVVISGNNQRKTDYIEQAVAGGFHVLADKPMAINPKGFTQLRRAFRAADRKQVLLYDIMTERYEVTAALQRELARLPKLFGELEKGTAQNPGVVMENVHHYYKQVSGKPLIRPAWFFDVLQQGEAIPDVGTHLVDLVQWTCFPDQVLSWQRDIKVRSARIWPTLLTRAQFKQVTGCDDYPAFLRGSVGADGQLSIRQNGEVAYTLRGVQVRVSARWNYEAPPGAGDSHYALVRGSRANLVIRQGLEEKFVPTLYIENSAGTDASEFARAVQTAVGKLQATWPGVGARPAGSAWVITVPEKYHVGHEAHFAQVTEKYLRFLATGRMPEWETAAMLAKYYTTTEAYRLSR